MTWRDVTMLGATFLPILSLLGFWRYVDTLPPDKFKHAYFGNVQWRSCLS